jgi:hypothetical protein
MNFDDITFDDIDLEVEVGDTPEVNTREAIIERVAAGEKTLSYSALMAFAKSPRNLMAYWMRTVQPTDAMIYGRWCIASSSPPNYLNKSTSPLTMQR